MDKPCKNCGFNSYELVDGYYYCTECQEVLENWVEKEINTYENENIVFDVRTGIKQKDKKPKKVTSESTLTSYEEYNYILRGLVDEILAIDKIPKFKKTVLQLWISFIKYIEVGFHNTDGLAHLPKFHCFYREQDAKILYNKNPVKKKAPKRKIKPKKETWRSQRKSSRRSLKKIQKIDEDSKSGISNTSDLSNLTLEDIEANKASEELHIEFSNVAKRTRQKIQNYFKKRNMKYDFSEEDDKPGKQRCSPDMKDITLVLSGKTLLMILYCGLNICGSSIQLSDLLRFAREGHISYYNFRKFLPEHIDNVKLSLTKYHGLSFFYSHNTLLLNLECFLKNFPEIKSSLILPNLMSLARRYIADMNLPNCLVKYVEKLMELLPTKFTNQTTIILNFEARAMSYVLFIIKLLFGIDGFREKEISESVKAINIELMKLKSQKIFNYEAWREYIEFREFILSKYYYPSIFYDKSELEHPYENFMNQLTNIQPEKFDVYYSNEKVHKSKLIQINRKMAAKELAQKLMNLHEESPSKKLKFDYSFTPLKDAFQVILDSHLVDMETMELQSNFSDDTLEYFFDPKQLVILFSENGKILSTKKSTFPKNFSFQKLKSLKMNSNVCRPSLQISHDIANNKEWIKNIKALQKDNVEKELDNRVAYHEKKIQQLMKKRKALKLSIAFKNGLPIENVEKDEIFGCNEEVSNEKEDDEKLTFVHPDFNLWHRHMQGMKPRTETFYKKDVEQLSKSMMWLLNIASKVIYQNPEAVYFELMLLEHELLNLHKPLELTENQLELTTTKKRLNMHTFW